MKLREELSAYCSFYPTLERTDRTSQPVQEIGFTRIYYTNPFCMRKFTVHQNLETTENLLEMSEVCNAFTQTFPTASFLENYCVLFAEDLRNGMDYRLYCTQKIANYQVEIRFVRENCIVTIHAYSKKERKKNYV